MNLLRTAFIIVSLLAAMLPSHAGTIGKRRMLVVVGVSGNEPYGKEFLQWAKAWQTAASSAGMSVESVGLKADKGQREILRKLLEEEGKEGDAELWIVLVGHGSFDGEQAKFNLHGEDVSAQELKKWLSSFQRPLVIINFSSASAPFLAALSGPRRTIITATRSGTERNFARLGAHLSKTINDPSADLDKDNQTSLLEAFLAASRQTQEYYKSEQRIVTEHALIDDNGDGRGTPASGFDGLQPKRVRTDEFAPDGHAAHQIVLVRSAVESAIPETLRVKRDEIERQISQLRDRKDRMEEDAYYAELEPLLVELAKLYDLIEKEPTPEPRPKPAPAPVR